MSVRARCPKCGNVTTISESDFGTVICCPDCGQALKINSPTAKIAEQADRIAELEKQLAESATKREEPQREAAKQKAHEKLTGSRPSCKPATANPNDRAFGSRNRIVTKAQADKAWADLNKIFGKRPEAP